MLEIEEFQNYEILIINSKVKEVKNLKLNIENVEKRAYENGKKGVILLAGNQCSLGITLPLVDIVFLMNNITSCDKIMQMMYRCMSESNDGTKKIGFVVDFNLSRVLHTFIEYPLVDPNLTSNEKIRYIIENNLIHLDEDIFESKENKGILINKLLDIWKNNPLNETQKLMKKIHNLVVKIDDIDQKYLNGSFFSLGNNLDEIFIKFDEENFQIIPNGHHKTSVLNLNNLNRIDDDNIDNNIDNNNTLEFLDDSMKNKNDNISFVEDILPLIIPLVRFMNSENNLCNFFDMLLFVYNSYELKEVMNCYIENLWEKKNLFEFIFRICKKYLIHNLEINNISYQFKMTYASLLNTPDALLKYLKESLKPKELEKKKFGEVFTPIELINEMMDKLDEVYKKENKGTSIFTMKNLRWYDPAAGMGSFLVCIYYRLMDGLKYKIKDDEKRKKHILENMLFMGEINKKNCFIMNKVFQSNKYKVNIYCGDSLKLEFDKTQKFDVIVGNPPFQDDKKSGDNKKYLEMTQKALIDLKKDGYLMFITPRNILDYLLLQEKNRKYIDIFYKLPFISMETCNKYFNVASSFIWFILQNKIYEGLTEIEFTNYNGKIKYTTLKLYEKYNLPKYLNKIDIDIINKLIDNNDDNNNDNNDNNDNKFHLKDVKFGNKSQRIRKELINKGIVSPIKTKLFKYKIIDTINKKNPFPPIDYYYYDKLDNDIDKDKIVISKKGYLMPFIDDTHKYTYSDNFKIITDKRENLNNILKIFKSPIIEYLIKQFSKHGFDNIHALELLNQKKNVINDDVFKTYHLTDNEKNHILNVV